MPSFTQEETAGLKALFGKGLAGAEATLQRNQIEIPASVTPDTLRRYREIAQEAIDAGKDSSGVQKKRIEIIDRLLRQQTQGTM